MKLSQEVGAPIVKAFESCLAPAKNRPGFITTYYCPAGVLTIGWGTTRSDVPTLTPGTVWSQKQCDDAFETGMTKYERLVEKQLQGTKVTQAQFDALASWTYNTGGPASSAVWTYARKGDVEQTCIRLSRWNKGGGRVLRGLVRRRDAECALYRGQIDKALSIAGARRASPNNELIEPHGKATDRPVIPPAEVARRTKAEAGAVVGGAAAGTASTTVDSKAPAAAGGVSWGMIGAGVAVAVVIVAAVLLIRKTIKLNADWA